ncbi:hypothetical protein WJX79_010880 [Trebouxia sp. C0005]
MTSDLNLHLDSQIESPEDARHREAKQAEGDDIQLRLMLPNGKEETLAAKLGQTVQYTKAVIHERFEVPIERQALTCEGHAMIDPLSLADCTGITSNGLNLIQVQTSS